MANGDKISEAAKQRINANIFACTLHIDMHNNTSTQHTTTPHRHHTIIAKLDSVARARTPQKRKLAQTHTECKVRQETAASAAVTEEEKEDKKKSEAKHEIDCLKMRAHGRLYASEEIESSRSQKQQHITKRALMFCRNASASCVRFVILRCFSALVTSSMGYCRSIFVLFVHVLFLI